MAPSGNGCVRCLILAAGYSLCAALLFAIAIPAHAQTNFLRLKSFGLGGASNPRTKLLQGSDGALYGTTFFGGSNDLGTVFQLKPDGSGSGVLHHFTGREDGDGPRAGLVEGNDGALYGTTDGGGANNEGTVFTLRNNGTGYTVLLSFGGGSTDGRVPDGLMEGSDGALYGITVGGGTNDYGTVFKLNTNGSGCTQLHSFTAGNQGRNPCAAMIEGTDGALYGTTFLGGPTSLAGTIFKLNRDGSGYTVLHGFRGRADGLGPDAPLLEGRDGALYGTTFAGGSGGGGVVFKVNKNGSDFTVLRAFTSNSADGATLDGGLIQTSDGALYGTTIEGGDVGSGIVFKLFAAPAVSLSISRITSSNEGARLVFAGVASQAFRVQAAINLVNPVWEIIGTNGMIGSDGLAQFLDASAANHVMRFYRAVMQ